MKFRRKQTEVDAVQFVDGRIGEAIDFCALLDVRFGFGSRGDGRDVQPVRVLETATLHDEPVNTGDWLVKDTDGTCSVVVDEDFRTEYEKA